MNSRPLRPGQSLNAREQNRLAQGVRASARMAGSGDVGVVRTGGDPVLLDARPRGHWAMIQAKAAPPDPPPPDYEPPPSHCYPHVALSPGPGPVDLWEPGATGPGAVLPWGTETLTPAMEISGHAAVPAGTRVWLEPGLGGWQFRGPADVVEVGRVEYVTDVSVTIDCVTTPSGDKQFVANTTITSKTLIVSASKDARATFRIE